MTRAFHLRARRGGVGDTVALTPLVRDLAAAYPGGRLSVEGTAAAELLRFDPRVGPRAPDAVEVLIDYKPAVDRSGGRRLPDGTLTPPDTAVRYLYAAHEEFEAATGLAVPRGPARPSLVLGPAERARPDPLPYHLVSVGCKPDMPLKAWPPEAAAEVVRATAAEGWRWKQVGLLHDGRYPHRQHAIREAEPLLGRTDLRRLLGLVAHADAVLCLTSLAMLVAAAFETPCVAVGGGREDPWLHADAGVDYLHTVGRLPCCADRGCRRWAALPGRFQEEFGARWRLCLDPVGPPGKTGVGRCMTLHTPAEVVAALRAAKARDARRHNTLEPSGGSGRPVPLPVIDSGGAYGSDRDSDQ